MGPLLAGTLISGGSQLLGGIFSAFSSRGAARDASDRADALRTELASLELSRQKIKNPYRNSTDLSSMLSNPFDGLAVATQAAAMQIEQADISLANSLDTIRATGAGSGGATALAQAALKSKKGVSATIEKQEVNNERMKAQGEQTLQRLQMAEKQRMQSNDAAGEIFEFNAREKRQNQKLNRVAGQMDNALAQESQYNSDVSGAIAGTVSGLAGTASGYMGAMSQAGAFGADGFAKNKDVNWWDF